MFFKALKYYVCICKSLSSYRLQKWDSWQWTARFCRQRGPSHKVQRNLPQSYANMWSWMQKGNRLQERRPDWQSTVTWFRLMTPAVKEWWYWRLRKKKEEVVWRCSLVLWRNWENSWSDCSGWCVPPTECRAKEDRRGTAVTNPLWPTCHVAFMVLSFYPHECDNLQLLLLAAVSKLCRNMVTACGIFSY